MYSFVDIIKRNDLNVLMGNLQLFDNLSDDEIKNIYDDFDVNDDIKNIISEKCSERINSLPVDIFLDVIAYSKNSSLFINNYLNRINSFSYNEMVKLIYDCYLEQDCLVKILQTDIFQYYLKNENTNDPKLKCCWYKYKIRFFCNNIERIEQVGIEICKLVNDVNVSHELLNDLIDNYLSIINSDEFKHQHTQQIDQEVIYLINCKIKSHKLLSPEMIKSYILFRVKELNLDKIVENVVITDDNNISSIGYFHGETKTIAIKYKYLENIFKEACKSYDYDENTCCDLNNYKILEFLSHEINHARQSNKYFSKKEEKRQKLELSNACFNDNDCDALILDYYLKNGLLMSIMDYDNYRQSHDKFIEENISDLFGILDASNQVEKYFKNSFPKELLQIFQIISANRILRSYYSDEFGNYKSPLDKFDTFYNQTVNEIVNNSKIELGIADNSKYDLSNLSGLEMLMIGGDLPDYMLYELKRIADEEVKVTNLYSHLKQADMNNMISNKNIGI